MISPLLYENKLYFVPQQGLSRVSGVMRPSPLSDKYSGQLSFSQICYFGFLDSSFPRHIWKVLINNDVFQIQHEMKKIINQVATIILGYYRSVWILINSCFILWKKRPPSLWIGLNSHCQSILAVSGRSGCKYVTLIEDYLLTQTCARLLSVHKHNLLFSALVSVLP